MCLSVCVDLLRLPCARLYRYLRVLCTTSYLMHWWNTYFCTYQLVVQKMPLYLQSSAQETDISGVHKVVVLVCVCVSVSLSSPNRQTYRLDFLSMKWQWTYGQTLLPWNNHFHTSKACLKILNSSGMCGLLRSSNVHPVQEKTTLWVHPWKKWQNGCKNCALRCKIGYAEPTLSFFNGWTHRVVFSCTGWCWTVGDCIRHRL